LNEVIPVQYTYDGENINPLVQFKNVPANEAELMPFVIDDNCSCSSWVVSDVSPNTKSAAAGQVHGFGIAGSDTQSHAFTYAGYHRP